MIGTRAKAVCGLLLFASLNLSACSDVPQPAPRTPVRLTLVGDDSMEWLGSALADAYTQQHPYATIQVEPANSAVGLSAVTQISGTIGMVSRVVRPAELVGTRAVVVARDGIAIIVNRANPINAIMRSQIAQVFSGQVPAWPTGPSAGKTIMVVSREDGSGTQAAFESMAMGGERVTPTAVVMPSDAAMVDFVAQHPEAIGYCSMSSLTAGVQAMNVDDVPLSTQSVESQKYTFVRTLAFIVPAPTDPATQSFLDFSLGSDGQRIVAQRLGRAP